MHALGAETQRRSLDRAERRHQPGERRALNVALHSRQRDVRPEGLVVERDVPLPESTAYALPEKDEPIGAFTRAEPHHGRQPAHGETPDPVEHDLERRNAGRSRPDGFRRRPELVGRGVPDKGERQVKQRCWDMPERGEVSGKEFRRALG